MSGQETLWLEVELRFDDRENGEGLEAAVEVLNRWSRGRVVWSYEKPRVDARNAILGLGPLRLRAYIPVPSEALEGTRQRIREALWHLSQLHPLPEPRFRLLKDEDWLHAWRRFYRPIPVGKRLVVVPAWVEQAPEAEGRLPVFIDPGAAFGTGMHPSTRLALQALEQVVQPGDRVIDIGCGSGILSIAAVRLGARAVLAVDIQEEAVRETRHNARRNGVEAAITVLQGSVPEVLAGRGPFQTAQVVVANILADVLIDLLNQGMARLLEAQGHLVLSGILQEHAADVAQAAAAHGLALTSTLTEEDWVAQIFQPKADKPDH